VAGLVQLDLESNMMSLSVWRGGLALLLMAGMTSVLTAGPYSSLGGTVADGLVMNNLPGTSLNLALTTTSYSTGGINNGDFANIGVVTMWATPVTVQATSAFGQVITLSSAPWGTFQGTVAGDTGELSLGPSFYRFVTVQGTYLPGTDPFFNGETEKMDAILSYSFTKATGTAAIGGSWSMVTVHSPEPSTLVLAGLAGLGVVFHRVRRR
jgi:hypothetical protein